MPRANHLFTVLFSAGCALAAVVASASDLPPRWDDLTATQWPEATERSGQTCILPFGVLEKHGPHAPIGSDMIKARELALRAAQREYAVVFPDYYFGQIHEARHQPGTFAVSERMALDLLDATCEEIARNGFKRILILNGHGGNPPLIHYFGQTRLEKRRSYVLYFYNQPEHKFLKETGPLWHSNPEASLHAGEDETSMLLELRPQDVHLERARDESGEDQKRITVPPELYTPIWWYGRFPNHYAGEGDKATRELGAALVERTVAQLAELLKFVKTDQRTLDLQNEFFDRAEKLSGK
jgi:creatinine amidohydrolase